MITPVDFTYDQLQAKFSGNQWIPDGTARKIYSSATFNVTIYPSGTEINDIFYINN
jgi:hypothetical protein